MLWSIPSHVSAAALLPRYASRAFAPSSFFGLRDKRKPSIGASTESWPHLLLIEGNAKKSRSFAAFGSVNWIPTNDPSTYMPVFLLARLVPPSCHVRPRNPGWDCGISSRQVVET